ncbi:Hint domain-containing protein [uncultured Roseovarius sp.]|uniref:Hint domain-containing protein n=1 Tax=uncultured Roseovarius sp. TaxID=293344 RepID=UPI0025F2A709|nr:Hint domain-containing protein [uncultured Roseovarius sp.]
MACITRIDCDSATPMPAVALGQLTQDWHAALNVAKASGKSLTDVSANDPSAPHGESDDTAQPRLGLPEGTLIDTLAGQKPVESLKPHDILRTESGGYRPLRHILRIDHDEATRHATIHIKAGAFGPNLPSRNTQLPRDQKVLVRSEVAKHMFPEGGAFVAAHVLTHLPDVTVAQSKQCHGSLYLLLLDEPETILANGIPTDTLVPCADNLTVIPAHLRKALTKIYPGFSQDKAASGLQWRLPLVKRQNRLIKRHAKSGAPLLAVPDREREAETA